MPITINLLNETFSLINRTNKKTNSARLKLNELVSFDSESDLNNFIQKNMSLCLEFNFTKKTSYPFTTPLAEFEKEELFEPLNKIPKMTSYKAEYRPILKSFINGRNVDYSVSLVLSGDSLKDFLKTGSLTYDNVSEDRRLLVSTIKKSKHYPKIGRSYLKHIENFDEMGVFIIDGKGRKHFLGTVDIDFDALAHKKIDQVKVFDTNFSDNLHLYKKKYNLALPPGSQQNLAQPEKDKTYYDVKVHHFRPDTAIGFLRRKLNKDQTYSFELIPPGEIYDELKKNNQYIRFTVINKSSKSTSQKGLKIYDKIILPFPILFSPKSDFKLTIKNSTYSLKSRSVSELHEEQSRNITYHYNQLRTYTIYTGNETKNNKIKQLKEKSKKIGQIDVNNKTLLQDTFITRKEYVPLRYDAYLSAAYKNLNLKREASSENRFIHISPVNPLQQTKAIALNKVLPRYLLFKYKDYRFCLIQYNTSKTIPKTKDSENAVPGYFSQNSEKLKPGKIYRNLSFDDLKQIKLHPEYGGSYYVLAACTKEYMKGVYDRNYRIASNVKVFVGGHFEEKPELWTIYTEGKDWNLLNTNRDKNNKIAYPYKINY